MKSIFYIEGGFTEPQYANYDNARTEARRVGGVINSYMVSDEEYEDAKLKCVDRDDQPAAYVNSKGKTVRYEDEAAA